MALGILFVLLAMLVTLVRVGGPLLNQYRESLIHTLLGDSQLKVSVGQVGLDWTQSGPALELQQLAIAPDSGRFTVQLGKAWVHLDFWRTINELKPVFGELILSDGDITLDFSLPANGREPEGESPTECPAALSADPTLYLRYSQYPPQRHHRPR